MLETFKETLEAMKKHYFDSDRPRNDQIEFLKTVTKPDEAEKEELLWCYRPHGQQFFLKDKSSDGKHEDAQLSWRQRLPYLIPEDLTPPIVPALFSRRNANAWRHVSNSWNQKLSDQAKKKVEQQEQPTLQRKQRRVKAKQ